MSKKNKKWYAINYAGFWQIQDTDFYEKTDVLDADHVGEEQAESNAKLCASAPEMKELLDDMYKQLKFEIEISTYKIDEYNPIVKLLDRYNKLIEK